MSHIDRLRSEIEKVEALVSAPPPSGESRARDLGYLSLKRHLGDLRDSLRLALALRSKEVIEVDLGEKARPGTVRLGLLGGLSKGFSAAVEHAARHKWRGTKRGPMPRQIMTTMDLRLAALAGGSTRLFVVGNTAPDLFGRSLLEDSLRETFAVLQAQDADTLAGAVAIIGTSGTNALKQLLRTVATEELDISIKWEAPDDEQMVFEANPVELSQLAQSLEQLEAEERPPVTVHGVVITISSREPFKVEAGGALYAAAVPPDLLATIETLHVGQVVTARLSPTVVSNRVTGGERVSYSLLSVSGAAS